MYRSLTMQRPLTQTMPSRDEIERCHVLALAVVERAAEKPVERDVVGLADAATRFDPVTGMNGRVVHDAQDASARRLRKPDTVAIQ